MYVILKRNDLTIATHFIFGTGTFYFLQTVPPTSALGEKKLLSVSYLSHWHINEVASPSQ